jgi:hypothetical protein
LYFQETGVLKSDRRTRFALLVVVALIFYIVKSQIAYYLFATGTGNGEYDFTARAVLYRTAAEMLRDFFPFGSGFASFATEASGMYYSQIYSVYKLGSVSGFTPQDWLSVTGSYYPSLAQFGIIGILLYLFFWIYIVSKSLIRFKREGDLQLFVLVMLIACFIFIENIPDSFFTSNKGFYLMMLLGMLTGKYKKSLCIPVDGAAGASVPVQETPVVEKEVMPPIQALYEMPPAPVVAKEAPVAENLPESELPVEMPDETAYIEEDEWIEEEEIDEDELIEELDDDDEFMEEPDVIDEATPVAPLIEENEPMDELLPEDDLTEETPELSFPEDDFSDEFPTFAPLLDNEDDEWADKSTAYKPVREEEWPDEETADGSREEKTGDDKDDERNDYMI